jgi:cysteine-rich repeat protein
MGTTTAGSGDATTTGAICGDGQVDEGEDCDDGDDIDGNGCNNDCFPSATEISRFEVTEGGVSDLVVRVDSTIVVAGGAGDQLWVQAFAPSGRPVWDAPFMLTGTPSTALGVAADGEGNVAASGWTTPVGQTADVDLPLQRRSGGGLGR